MRNGSLWLESLGADRFLLRAVRALQAEVYFAQRALPLRSSGRWRAALDAALIATQRLAIEQAGASALLGDKRETLNRATCLLARLERGVVEMAHRMQQDVRSKVDRCVSLALQLINWVDVIVSFM